MREPYASFSSWRVYRTLSGSGLSTTSSRPSTRETTLLCCILAVTALVYLRSLSNAFVLDDVPMVVKNPNLGDWSFVWKSFTREEFWYSDADFLPHFRNYRPLLLVWYWIDFRLFGLNPAPWHASAILVHLVAVWLVFKVTRLLSGDSTTALLAASLFALTPVHVAAVVWVAGSGFALATAFGLAAFYLILPPANDSVRRWAAAVALYACALLSHESAIAFPALVACYAFIFIEETRASFWMRVRRAVIWSAPFAIELLLYLCIRRLVLGFFVSNPYDFANLLTNAQAVLTVPLVFATYLAILAIPTLTMPNHNVLPVSSLLSPEFWMPLAAIMLILAAFLILALRSPRRRLYLFCGAWIGITLAPMLLLHSVYHMVQDYYLYLPSVGSSLLLGDLLAVLSRKNADSRRLAIGCSIAMLAVYALTLWRVQRYWHDDVTAAKGYVEGCPISTAWHLTLARYLEQAGDLVQAENEVRTALSLEPDRTGTIHPGTKELDQILGELMAKRGDIAGAELQLRKSMSDTTEHGAPSSPDQVAHVQRILLLYEQGLRDKANGRRDQAIPELTDALDQMESFPTPEFFPLSLQYVPLVELYDSQGDSARVKSLLEKLNYMPEGELAVGLARAEIMLNHNDKRGAERILLELADKYPDNPEVSFRLGGVQADLNENEQALNSYERILHWFAHPRLYASKAKSLHAMGRDREALDQCRLALALASPHDLETLFVCTQIQYSVDNK